MTRDNGLDADVVLVDQDPTVRRLSRMVLEALGCRVRQARDCERALAFIDDRGAPIDLLIAEVRACDVCGVELARRARATRPALKVLFVLPPAHSWCHWSPSLHEGERVLAKPYGGRDLASAVRSLLLTTGSARFRLQPATVTHRVIQ